MCVTYCNSCQTQYPNRQVVGIIGDGAFDMVIRFATAVQYDLPMTLFVLNNEQLSFIKYEQQLPVN